MKCRRLPFNGRSAWLHRLWCAECRAHAQIDDRIQREIDAFASHVRQEAQKRAPAPSGGRVWGLQYAVLCVAIGAIAAALLLLPRAKQLETPIRQKTDTIARRPFGDPVVPRREQPLRIDKVVQEGPRPGNGGHRRGPEIRKAPLLARQEERTLDYLNEDKALFASRWTLTSTNTPTLGSILNRPLPPMKDDFVAPPEFLFASESSPEQLAHNAAEAEAEYRRQASITDIRLERKVKFASKNDSLAEVCESLRKQTGVSIYAGRSVADDNVSIFIASRPAKDVMRFLTRLLGYTWRRTGSDNAYSYVLEQEMKDQVAEDKLRNEDLSGALSKVVEAAKRKPKPDSQEGPLANPLVDDIVRTLFGGLSIDEFQELRSGKEISLSNKQTTRPLDSDKAIQLMESMGHVREIGQGQYILTGQDGKLPSEFPGTTVKVSYKLAVLELGGINATGSVLLTLYKDNGEPLLVIPRSQTLAIVPGVGEADPRNALANADLAKLPQLQANVNVKPEAHTYVKKDRNYPIKTWTESTRAGGHMIWKGLESLVPSPEYATTGDIWAAIHAATGLDVVADSFSRIFPSAPRSGSLFDVLNQYGDFTNMRWRYQDGVVYARSTTYAWQRLNETPKRLIEKWKLSRKRGAATIHDLISMAQLNDRQLDSYLSGKTIYHYHDIPEWGLVARPWMGEHGMLWRKFLRILASMPPATVDQMVNRAIPIDRVPQACMARLLDEFGPWRGGIPTAIAIDYLPSETFFWRPPATSEYVQDSLGFTGKTAEEVRSLLAKRNIQPEESEIVHTVGHLKLTLYGANRKLLMEIGDGGQVMYITGN